MSKRLWMTLAAGWALVAQPADLPQPASTPLVELRGSITKVAVEPRQGPRLLVKAESGEEWTVWLGSFRYLLEQGFNPKAGQQVNVRGVSREKAVLLAHSITVKETGRTLELRHADGRPLWRGQGRRAIHPPPLTAPARPAH